MKKAMIGTLFLLVAVLVPFSASAQIGVSVNVGVPLPPPIVFTAPPEVVVLPETNVYAVPDVEADIYFSQGWWWRPWEGRWYRSRQYDGGWAFYRQAPPPFYRNVPPGWRNDYREHRWRGREWNHERIPHGEMERNWRGWERDRHWQQRNAGGARGMEPRPGGPRGNAQRMERRPEGPVQMRGPQPAFQGQPQRGMRDREFQGPHGQPRQDGRGFQPGPQGPRGGGPMGGPNRGPGPGGPGPGRGNDHRGGPGRR
jgi:hypothetical protein